jgi:hypothetical protein
MVSYDVTVEGEDSEDTRKQEIIFRTLEEVTSESQTPALVCLCMQSCVLVYLSLSLSLSLYIYT